MEIPFRLIGHLDTSKDGESPTAWLDERTGRILMQGYTVTDARELAALSSASDESHRLPLPHPNEMIIDWPQEMLPVFKEIVNVLEARAGDAADGD